MDAPQALNSAQTEELRLDLEQLKAELESLLDASTESGKTVELDQAQTGRLSRMDALQGQQMALATRRRTQVRLKQVLAAQARMRADEYGYCLLSDEPIGFPRLKAQPETPYSLASKTHLETR